MIRKLVISRQAETDLILIWIFYAEKSERAAARIRKNIISKYDLLLQFPRAGRSRNELQEGLRSLSVRNHIIFYREIEAGLEIVRVLYGVQDFAQVFPPEDVNNEK